MWLKLNYLAVTDAEKSLTTASAFVRIAAKLRVAIAAPAMARLQAAKAGFFASCYSEREREW
ncbi:MAG: hypothetical protein N3E52_05740 [Candidatus Bathyarchaeota archaeon]|nr:hypothetical protein [Candidatus Bathyarchaeota archaeon]